MEVTTNRPKTAAELPEDNPFSILLQKSRMANLKLGDFENKGAKDSDPEPEPFERADNHQAYHHEMATNKARKETTHRHRFAASLKAPTPTPHKKVTTAPAAPKTSDVLIPPPPSPFQKTLIFIILQKALENNKDKSSPPHFSTFPLLPNPPKPSKKSSKPQKTSKQTTKNKDLEILEKLIRKSKLAPPPPRPAGPSMLSMDHFSSYEDDLPDYFFSSAELFGYPGSEQHHSRLRSGGETDHFRSTKPQKKQQKDNHPAKNDVFFPPKFNPLKKSGDYDNQDYFFSSPELFGFPGEKHFGPPKPQKKPQKDAKNDIFFPPLKFIPAIKSADFPHYEHDDFFSSAELFGFPGEHHLSSLSSTKPQKKQQKDNHPAKNDLDLDFFSTQEHFGFPGSEQHHSRLRSGGVDHFGLSKPQKSQQKDNHPAKNDVFFPPLKFNPATKSDFSAPPLPPSFFWDFPQQKERPPRFAPSSSYMDDDVPIFDYPATFDLDDFNHHEDEHNFIIPPAPPARKQKIQKNPVKHAPIVPDFFDLALNDDILY
ncbi:uncharacterized protein LOC118437572 [Folsomia candida]|uniref:uncharacterized protein LOC118437572 n=1 Tax=Folsomia candida TaxID=158441 RepID=UPI001604D8BF|nr:uncharacterized protein LOC118437572 [Folsomia candida]